jgi:hypothetical protein
MMGKGDQVAARRGGNQEYRIHGAGDFIFIVFDTSGYTATD